MAADFNFATDGLSAYTAVYLTQAQRLQISTQPCINGIQRHICRDAPLSLSKGKTLKTTTPLPPAMRTLAMHPAARGLNDDAAVLDVGGETLVLTHDTMRQAFERAAR